MRTINALLLLIISLTAGSVFSAERTLVVPDDYHYSASVIVVDKLGRPVPYADITLKVQVYFTRMDGYQCLPGECPSPTSTIMSSKTNLAGIAAFDFIFPNPNPPEDPNYYTRPRSAWYIGFADKIYDLANDQSNFVELISPQYSEQDHITYTFIIDDDAPLQPNNLIFPNDEVSDDFQIFPEEFNLDNGFSSHSTSTTGFNVYMYYGYNKVQAITKPILLIEGIDFDNEKNDWKRLYPMIGRDFIENKLRGRGYDVIIVDFKDGTNFLENNARSVMNAIAWTNQQLALNGSSENIILVGASMGGVLSRYALKEMENRYLSALINNQSNPNQWNHNTKLWTSFDSPQQGANIPIADQAFLSFFSALDPKSEKKFKNLGKPAPRQLMKSNYKNAFISNGPFGIKNLNYSNNNSDHDVFFNELLFMGYPMYLEKIGISNGSGFGNDGLQKTSDGIQSMSSSGELMLKVGCDGSCADVEWDIKLYSSNINSSDQLVFNGIYDVLDDDWYSFSSLLTWVPFGIIDYALDYADDIGVSGTPLDEKIEYWFVKNANSLYQSVSMFPDNAPGGYRETQKEIYNKSKRALRSGGGEINLYFSKHCFIPTTSALDLRNSTNQRVSPYTKLIGTDNDLTKLPVGVQTPFDHIRYQTENEKHVFISQSTGDWLDELLTPMSLVVENKLFDKWNRKFTGTELVEVKNTQIKPNLLGGTPPVFEVSSGKKIVISSGTTIKSGAKFLASIDPNLIVNGTQNNTSYLMSAMAKSSESESDMKKDAADSVKTEIPTKPLELPTTFSLDQNYPNPFNPTTTMRYALKEDVAVTLKIYNMLGQEVKTLVNNQKQAAGFKSVMWDGRNNYGHQVPSGTYIYRLQAGTFIQTRKMLLVK
ncbi:T9SS type A sorting domain-containing protein [bacterium]|nr:T9SS type A sorting domain-containing protein [bacterium]NUN44387.1 T9SS type A sorting domain-containing protein [bacterium]